jgi:hypothetical protein
MLLGANHSKALILVDFSAHSRLKLILRLALNCCKDADRLKRVHKRKARHVSIRLLTIMKLIRRRVLVSYAEGVSRYRLVQAVFLVR